MEAATGNGVAKTVTTPPSSGAGAGTGGGKVRLMCSYGGHILPRPHDRTLCYLGGETRVVALDRRVALAELSAILSRLAGVDAGAFSIKYRLPNEDLDSLVSVATDDDLDVMLEEYDRVAAANRTAATPSRRLRLFLFPSKTAADTDNGGGSCGRGISVDDLLGLDGDNPVPSSPTAPKTAGSGDGQDEHSLPNSPLQCTPSSSSCSGSFVQSAGGGGPEEQSAQADVSGQRLDDGPGNAVMTTTCSTESPTRVFPTDDDNRNPPKQSQNHGSESSEQSSKVQATDQSSKMQITEQSHYAHTSPSAVQFQHQQTASAPVVPIQSYYTQQPVLQAHLYNPQTPVFLVPVHSNSAYPLPIQHCDAADSTAAIHPHHSPTIPNIPLPSPTLLPRGISLPAQKHEPDAGTGNRSTHVGNLADQNQQYMTCYYQVPRYITRPPSVANYHNFADAMAGQLDPRYQQTGSVALAKSASDPTFASSQQRQPRSSS